MIDLNTLGPILLKGSFLVVFASCVALAFRRSSAAVRHTIWLATTAALLVLPLAQLGLPRWNVDTLAMVAGYRSKHIPEESFAPAFPANSSLEQRPLHPETKPHQSVDKIGSTTYSPAYSLPAALQNSSSLISFASAAGWIWAAGALLVMAWLVHGLIRVRGIIRSARPFTSKPAACNVPVLVSERLSIPATAGIFRPVILLPVASGDWSAEQLQMILDHELAHITRKDWLWQLMAQLACAVHFFNPLVWVTARMLRSESEFACDDLVLSRGAEAEDYASTLLLVASRARFTSASLVAMARRPQVAVRLKAILDSSKNRTSASSFNLFGGFAMIFCLTLPVAALHARNHEQVARSGGLPQIPLVASKEIEPGVFLADNGVASLPGGFRVKLLGIGTQFEERFWNLDKSPMENRFYGERFHQHRHGESPMAPIHREFVVELESDHDASLATWDLITNPGPVTDRQRRTPTLAGEDDRLAAFDVQAMIPTFARINLGITKPVDRATYRFAVAGQKWTTISTLMNPYHGSPKGIKHGGIWPNTDSCDIYIAPTPMLVYENAKGHSFSAEFPGKPLIHANNAVRVVIYDSAGHVLPTPEAMPFGYEDYPEYPMTAAFLCKIQRIELQISPYQWVEFRDVPIRPNLEAETKANSTKESEGMQSASRQHFPILSKTEPS